MDSRFFCLFLLPLLGCASSCAASAGVLHDEFSGSELYAQHCARCHTQGVAGAPRPGYPEEWKGRLEVGRANLLLSVLKGRGGMPPKGGNASLTTPQADAALNFMLRAPVARSEPLP